MFIVKFETENAAFDEPDKLREIARVLREVAEGIENNAVTSGKAYDYNGNKIGFFKLEK